jgi:hypothetical protein
MSASGLNHRLRAARLTGRVPTTRLTQRLPATGLTGLARFYATCGSRAHGCGAALVIVGFAITQLFIFGH